jgi:hypothetical protein
MQSENLLRSDYGGYDSDDSGSGGPGGPGSSVGSGASRMMLQVSVTGFFLSGYNNIFTLKSSLTYSIPNLIIYFLEMF